MTGAVNRLLEVGVHVPEWQEIAGGLRPEDLGFAEWEPCEGKGWQRHASATVHEQYTEQVVWPHLSLAESIGEVAKWAPFVSPVHSPASPQDLKNGSRTVQSVALETPPHASLPAGVAVSSTSLATTAQRAAGLGELGKRGFAAESAVAQICRGGGARVSTNVMLRDLDISPPHSSDGRRLEVVAEGLCLFGGCQLALDATVVSTLHGDGTHRRKADVEEKKQEEAKRPDTRSCVGVMVEHDLWSLLERSEAGGLKRQRTSCGVWPARSPSRLQGCCRAASELDGTGGGVVSLHVQRRRLVLWLGTEDPWVR